MLSRYRALTAGEAGWGYLLRFELCMLLFRNVPGALGLILRKIFFPGLFGACGRGVLFGTGLTLRNPRAIRLGDKVVIDDKAGAVPYLPLDQLRPNAAGTTPQGGTN